MGAGKALKRVLRTLPKKGKGSQKKLSAEENIIKHREKKDREKSHMEKMSKVADAIVEGDEIDYKKLNLSRKQIGESLDMIKERDEAVKKMPPIKRKFYYQMMKKKKKKKE